MRSPNRNEHGAAALTFVILMIPLLLICAGLVIDGGYALSAKRRALGYAESTARIAADSLNEGTVRTGDISLAPAVAHERATAALAAANVDGVVQIEGDEAIVEVTISQPTAMLAMVGITHITVSSTASARSIASN